MITRAKDFFNEYYYVISVLFISGILRWILILRGGQFYFPDESRYGIAQDAMVLFLEGKVKTAIITLVGELAHIGFKVTALIPALFENLLETTLILPAVFFSFFSIFNLLLIWKISIATDAPIKLANYALFLGACSQVLLYYSRHLFPFDQAMFFGLLALYISLKGKYSPKIFFLIGILSFLCLVTYNGYWIIAVFVLFVSVFNGSKERNWFWLRSAFLGLGYLAPIAILIMVSFLVHKDFISDYGIYLQKIVLGSFSEGWSLPFEYFWHAEHWFIVILGVLLLVSLNHFRENKNKFLMVSLGGFLFIYLGLVIPSTIMRTFVVYARTARQLMPFLVLSAAYGLYSIRSWKNGRYWFVPMILTIVFAQAFLNYQRSYNIEYPRKLIRDIQHQYPDIEISSKMRRFYSPLYCRHNDFLLLNYHYIYNWTKPLPGFQGKVLMRVSHPINYLPYQYEEFTPVERQEIREKNFEFTFYKLDHNYLAAHKKEIKRCNLRR